ncbi:MAG: hypothetical protein ACOYKZ_02750 [Chlamydiia bacterium]
MIHQRILSLGLFLMATLSFLPNREALAVNNPADNHVYLVVHKKAALNLLFPECTTNAVPTIPSSSMTSDAAMNTLKSCTPSPILKSIVPVRCSSASIGSTLTIPAGTLPSALQGMGTIYSNIQDLNGQPVTITPGGALVLGIPSSPLCGASGANSTQPATPPMSGTPSTPASNVGLSYSVVGGPAKGTSTDPAAFIWIEL